MKKIKMVTLLFFILSIVVFLDLTHNYFNATFTELHDGIMLTGFFSRIIYGDNNWSLFRFYNGFIISLRIVSFLGILNIILAYIESLKKNCNKIASLSDLWICIRWVKYISSFLLKDFVGRYQYQSARDILYALAY